MERRLQKILHGVARQIRSLPFYVTGRKCAPEVQELLSDFVASRWDGVDLSRFPRVSKVSIGADSYFIRLYLPEVRGKAACYYQANRLANRANIAVPQFVGRCALHLGDRRITVLVEKAVDGQAVVDWDAGLAAALGRDLARWHSIPVYGLAVVLGPIPRCTLKWYAASMRRLSEVTLPTAVTNLFSDIHNVLNDRRLFTPLVVSHGDIHPLNLLRDRQDQLTWLDTEAACVRPVWHDLAAIESSMLLESSPQVLEAFETAYFSARAQDGQAWRELRSRWVFLYCCVEAANWLWRMQKPRLGADVGTEPGYSPVDWAAQLLNRARAARQLTDPQLSSWEWISRVAARAPWNRSELRVH